MQPVKDECGVWIVKWGQTRMSVSRYLAESVMRSLDRDVNDFRDRDRIVMGIAPQVAALLDAVAEKSQERYGNELDKAAEILTKVSPIGEVKALGRMEVVAALTRLLPTLTQKENVLGETAAKVLKHLNSIMGTSEWDFHAKSLKKVLGKYIEDGLRSVAGKPFPVPDECLVVVVICPSNDDVLDVLGPFQGELAQAQANEVSRSVSQRGYGYKIYPLKSFSNCSYLMTEDR